MVARGIIRQPDRPGRGLIGRGLPRGGGAPAWSPDLLFIDYTEAEDLALTEAALVSNWPGRNAIGEVTQPGASNLRPTYRVDDGSGHASVQFDGTDDWLAWNAAMVSAITGGRATMLTVWQSLATTSGRFHWTLGASSTTGRFAGVRSGSTLEAYLRLSNTVSLNFEGAGANAGGADYALMEYNIADVASRAIFTRAGGESFDLEPGQAAPDGLIDQGAFGCLYRTTTQAAFAQLRLRAWGYIDRLLTDMERAQLRAYLTTRYGY